MLHLKDPKGKEPELFQNIRQLKARVLDIAVHQVSEHTNLRIDYELVKKGRAYDAVRFTIARQDPQQLPIPFEQAAEDARAHAGRQHIWKPSPSPSRSQWPPSWEIPSTWTSSSSSPTSRKPVRAMNPGDCL